MLLPEANCMLPYFLDKWKFEDFCLWNKLACTEGALNFYLQVYQFRKNGNVATSDPFLFAQSKAINTWDINLFVSLKTIYGTSYLLLLTYLPIPFLYKKLNFIFKNKDLILSRSFVMLSRWFCWSCTLIYIGISAEGYASGVLWIMHILLT